MLGVVLALKLAVYGQLRDHPLLGPDAGLDTTAYADLARRVVAGDVWLGPGLYFVSPLYIYVLAAGLMAFGSFSAARVAQVVLGTLAVGLIGLMAREWFGARAAWIAMIMAAATGLFTFYEVLILQASIDPFLTSAALCALTFALRRRDRLAFVLAGIAFGLQTLNRPNVLLAAAGVGVTLLIVRRVRGALLLAAGVAIAMLPVVIRNAVVSHQFSFVSSHGGLNFYIGNSEGATGFYHAIAGVTPTIGGQETDARRVAEHALGRTLTEAEVSDYFFGLGRAWIVAHPGASSRLFARKLGYVFNAAHVALPHSYPFYAYDEQTLLRFLVVGPWLLIPLGLAGMAWRAWRERDAAFVAWAAFVPCYALAVAVFFVAERYRLPLLVPLAVTAGGAIDAVWTAVSERRIRTLCAIVASTAVLLVLVNWPLGLDDGRWQEGLRLAQRLVILGRYDEAASWSVRLRVHEPRPGATDAGIGEQLLVERQPGRASPYLQRALERRPGDAQLDARLGQALLQAGRAADAVPHLRRAYEAGVTAWPASYELAQALLATGRIEETAAVLRRLRAPADDADAALMAGRLAMQAHAPDVAAPFFAQAVRLRPGDAAAHQQYGLALMVLERFSPAVEQLGEASRLGPADADTLSRLAYCELQLGRRADARVHASAALALRPDDPLARQLVETIRR